MDINVDPWHLIPLTSDTLRLDFSVASTKQILAELVEDMLGQVQLKYDEYGIGATPGLILKPDADLHGKNLLHITSVEQVLDLTDTAISALATGREGVQITEFILQETIIGSESISSDKELESVIYNVGSNVVGGYYRTVEPNMVTNIIPLNDRDAKYFMFSVVSQLANLAASYERLYGAL